jgi:excinuclease UvrABC ATPase subunit
MRRRRLRLAIPLVGSLVVIAGCGGSSNSKLSYAAFSAAADKICSNANAQSKSAGAGVTGEATAANAAKIDKIVPIAQDALKKFQALKGPDSLQAAAQTAEDNLNQQIKAAQDASTAAKAGDQAAYNAALLQLQSLSNSAKTAGSKLGAKNCAT